MPICTCAEVILDSPARPSAGRDDTAGRGARGGRVPDARHDAPREALAHDGPALVDARAASQELSLRRSSPTTR
ncbi:hypothetical protein ACPCAG_23030 [Streptomyces pseudogriseolus]|uniref:hypothetical protein n=1 Tax=Streptomyces pseudogriseolus TaxID=36817 RepID=UPI003FA30A61